MATMRSGHDAEKARLMPHQSGARQRPDSERATIFWLSAGSILTAPERDELAAQSIACGILVKACERALFDFGLGTSDVPGFERIDTRAAGILNDILTSWRSTHQALQLLDLENAPSKPATTGRFDTYVPSSRDGLLNARHAQTPDGS